MKRKILQPSFAIHVVALPVFAHDLFLKLDSYFVKVNQEVSISVMNGTFQKSEGAVTFAAFDGCERRFAVRGGFASALRRT